VWIWIGVFQSSIKAAFVVLFVWRYPSNIAN